MKPAELAKRLSGQAFQAMREELMDKVLFTALRNSQQRTPVRTGTLRRSETTRQAGNGTKGFVGTNVKYGAYVHDGTETQSGQVKMKARPFFREGIEASRGEAEKLAQKAGEAFFKQVAKG